MIQRRWSAACLGSFLLWAAALAGCVAEEIPKERLLAALRASGPPIVAGQHLGPPVAAGTSGPARFVAPLLEVYEVERLPAGLAFIDGFYRAPANDGYEAALEHMRARLSEAGFGAEERFELAELSGVLEAASPERGKRVPAPAWTPLSASLELRTKGASRTLHAFDAPAARDRTMLPIHAPSCDVSGPAVFHLEDAVPGCILVVAAPLSSSLVRRAQTAGAVAVLSASYESFNVDPTGHERHLDLIQYRSLYYPLELPVGQISPRSLAAIAAASADDPGATLAFKAEVRLDERPLRTLVATIVGREEPERCVAISSHINEPGAGDNASGIVGTLEAACSLAEGIRSGKLAQPKLSVVFVWGDEFRMTQAWLAAAKRETFVGISADMLGQTKAKTGAIALVERMPDPGALRPLEPDRHTPWGAQPVTAEALSPNGLAVVARCAVADVGLALGGWETADHPWEGGSDHDVYIEAGIPALLLWHFTDFTYHTSLDRVDMVDCDEIERSCVALLALALALTDAEPGDLERYLESNDMDRKVRVDAALGEEDPELAESWRTWTTGARHWLRELCVPLAAAEPR